MGMGTSEPFLIRSHQLSENSLGSKKNGCFNVTHESCTYIKRTALATCFRWVRISAIKSTERLLGICQYPRPVKFLPSLSKAIYPAVTPFGPSALPFDDIRC